MAQTLEHNGSVGAVVAVSIPTFDDDVEVIEKLDDEPNDRGGMTAAELKAAFDEAGVKIKSFLNNELIPTIIAQDATEEARQEAEVERVANEQERVSNENARVAAEQSRVNAEAARVLADAARDDKVDDIVMELEAAKEAGDFDGPAGPAGPQGPPGPAFTYGDFTQAQLNSLIAGIASTGGIWDSIDLSLAPASWSNSGSGAFPWLYNVTSDKVTADLVPLVVLDPTSLEAAEAAGISSSAVSGSGYVQLTAAQQPTATITGVCYLIHIGHGAQPGAVIWLSTETKAAIQANGAVLAALHGAKAATAANVLPGDQIISIDGYVMYVERVENSTQIAYVGAVAVSIVGPQGIQGGAGPNLIDANTETSLTGFLKGDGTSVSAEALKTLQWFTYGDGDAYDAIDAAWMGRTKLPAVYYQYRVYTLAFHPNGSFTFVSMDKDNNQIYWVTATSASGDTVWSNGHNALQTALTFDAAPTANSTNPVTSGGVYTAIQNAIGNAIGGAY